MIEAGVRLDGRQAVLAETGDHPYARLTTSAAADIVGFRLGDTVVWLNAGPTGRNAGPTGRNAGPTGLIGYALGDGTRAARFFASAGPGGPVPRPRLLHLPPVPEQTVASLLDFTRLDRWEFLITTTPPAARPGEQRVVPLGEVHHAAINEVLDDALPESTGRPGDPRTVCWHGIFAGSRLIACGADRSRGGVGFLASLAVASDVQGRGLGGALTAALTRQLLTRYDHATLGVYTVNQAAIRLYERLGYTTTLPRTSIHLPPRSA